MIRTIHSVFATMIGLRARIAKRIERIEPLRRKLGEYAVLFAVLVTVYSFPLQKLWSVPACADVVIDISFGLVLLEFLVFTGWPFALLPLLDETWNSKDAGRVFLVAFITTNAFWMHKYHHNFCPFSFAFEVFPYVFAAIVGNAFGTFRPHHLIDGETESR